MAEPTNQTIEERLQAVEDQLAIYQVISGYGYAVDGLNTRFVRDCYTEDGVYEITGLGAYNGRDQVAGITSEPTHLDLVTNGCAHMSSLPHVVIEGDRAVATCHTMLATHSDGDFRIWRLSASRIVLVRQDDKSWKIQHREVCLLNGEQAGSELLGRLDEGVSTRVATTAGS